MCDTRENMPEPITQEKRYEDLVNAVSGGDLTMVKFLWKLVSEIDEVTSKTPQSTVNKMKRDVDKILKNLSDNPAKNGSTPTPAELKALIIPLIPKPKKGKPGVDGNTPSREFLFDMIDRSIPEPIPGETGKRGKTGIPGKIPGHRWTGTFIEFQNPDGSWGKKINLQGSPSEQIEYGGQPGGPNPYITVKKGNSRFEGVAEIVFADNLTVTKTSNGISVSGESGGIGGSIYTETPTGLINGSNVTYTVLHDITTVYSFAINGQFIHPSEYSVSGNEITMIGALPSVLSGSSFTIIYS